MGKLVPVGYAAKQHAADAARIAALPPWPEWLMLRADHYVHYMVMADRVKRIVLHQPEKDLMTDPLGFGRKSAGNAPVGGA